MTHDVSGQRFRWFATPEEITAVVADAKAKCASPDEAEAITRSDAMLRIEDRLYLAAMYPGWLARQKAQARKGGEP